MKKTLFAALLALPLIGFVSCSDDKDLPDVDFTVDVENATRVDGFLYVVQGDTLVVESITVTNREEGKNAIITQADYYWDGYFMGTSIVPPYGYKIFIGESTPVGDHQIDIQMPVFAEDKAAATALVSMKVVVVQEDTEIPDGGASTFIVTPRTSASAPK